MSATFLHRLRDVKSGWLPQDPREAQSKGQHVFEFIRKRISLNMNLDFIRVRVGFQVHDQACDSLLLTKRGGDVLNGDQIFRLKHGDAFRKAAAVCGDLSVPDGKTVGMIAENGTYKTEYDHNESHAKNRNCNRRDRRRGRIQHRHHRNRSHQGDSRDDAEDQKEPRHEREKGYRSRLLFVGNIVRQNPLQNFTDLIVFAKRNQHAKVGILVIVTAVDGVTDHFQSDGNEAEHSLNESLRDLHRLDPIVAEGVGVLLQNSVGYLNVVIMLCDGEVVISNEGMNDASDEGEDREQQHHSHRDQNGTEEIFSPRAERIKLQQSLANAKDDDRQDGKQSREKHGGGNVDECIQHFLAGSEAVETVLVGQKHFLRFRLARVAPDTVFLQRIQFAQKSVYDLLLFDDRNFRLVRGIGGAAVNRQNGEPEDPVNQILFFIDGVYLFVIEHRAFSEKHAPVAFDLFLRQLVARNSVIQDSVSDKAKIDYNVTNDENGNCRSDVIGI